MLHTSFNGYGRKPTLFVGALLFTIGAALQAGATTMLMLIIPRLISGFGIGMLSMCSPIYIAELAPARLPPQYSACHGRMGMENFVSLLYFLLLLLECLEMKRRNECTKTKQKR